MTGSLLFAAAFLACAVEAVEATTVVLAAGVTRSWKSSWRGVIAGILVLAAVVGAVGPAISSIPIGALRLIVGGLLLVFGLGWLRKAILRASGHKSLHDEASLYERYVAEARAAGRGGNGGRLTGGDAYGFTLAFKAVVLEGLEVAFIVVTFGANARRIPLAAAAALAAIAVVVALGFAVRGPLARVPENTIKFVVGVMLASFGTFWGAEGAGAHWPGNDASLLWLIPGVAVLAFSVAAALRSLRAPSPVPAPATVAATSGAGEAIVGGGSPAPDQPVDSPPGTPSALEPGGMEPGAGRAGAPAFARRALRGFGLFWWDFIVGDDWTIAAGVLVGLGAVAGLARSGTDGWWALPVLWVLAVLGSLARTVGRRRPPALPA